MAAPQKNDGDLRITVLRGDSLAAKDIGGKSDPYVRFGFTDKKGEWTKQVHKTKMKKKTLSPKWTENDKNSVLWRIADQGDGFNFRIDVFDWDPTSSDDFMGTYKMTYQELTSKQGDQTIRLLEDPIRFKGEKVSGTITIRFEYTPKNKASAHRAADVPTSAPTPAPVVVKEADNAGACPVVAEYRDVNKMKDLSVEHLLQQARGGDAYAMLALGIKYGNGDDCVADDELALEWYQKAADKGLAEGQFKVGLYNLMGYGTPNNDQKAFEWYSKAAAQENAGGCFGLGEIYESGWGRPIDLEQAKHWYSKAATLGDGDANMSLGRLSVTEKNYEAAHKYYQHAAMQDYEEAFYELGCLHENGLGTPVSLIEARAYYEKAQNLDSAVEALKRVSKA